jgi:hypothetical protein
MMSIIILIIIVVCIVIIGEYTGSFKLFNTSETFIEPRSFGGKMMKNALLSNAYNNNGKYVTQDIENPMFRSVVSNGAMANAGSIDQIVHQSQLNMNSNSNIPNNSTSGLTLVQDNVVQKSDVNNYVNSLSNENVDDAQNSKEGFFNTGIESVSVNAMGNLEGPNIYTNGQLAHGLTYDKIVQMTKEGKHVSDQSVAGAGKGDGFEQIYQDYVKIQDQHDLNPTGVRSLEEIDEITKSLNSNTNLASHNLLTRAGAGKTKIKLDPNGTVGVMDDNARRLPERERNHTIYATGHVVPIQGYSLDYTDQYQNLTNGGSGFGKAMASNVSEVITGIGNNAAANSKILNDKTNESFSVSGY